MLPIPHLNSDPAMAGSLYRYIFMLSLLLWTLTAPCFLGGSSTVFYTMLVKTMALRNIVKSICFLSFLPASIQAASQQYCKPIPGSADWPSDVDWQSLNTSISGRLIAPVPPGIVCQTNSSVHDTAACTQLYTKWSSSSYHANDPFTTDYNDDSCLPDPRAPCSTALLPAYVVNATNAADVQAAVRFAYRTGVRLIVKGTGHDYPGRQARRTSSVRYER